MTKIGLNLCVDEKLTRQPVFESLGRWMRHSHCPSTLELFLVDNLLLYNIQISVRLTAHETSQYTGPPALDVSVPRFERFQVEPDRLFPTFDLEMRIAQSRNRLRRRTCCRRGGFRRRDERRQHGFHAGHAVCDLDEWVVSGGWSS